MARKWLGIDPNAADESRIYTGIHLFQCQLSLFSGSLALAPFGGQYLSIGGINRKIPSAGITLAATGLSASTLYYIYAQYSSGTMSLLASTTAFATSTNAANVGVAVKSDDFTKTLVGMVFTQAGPSFADTTTVRLVRSYYNRVPIDVRVSFSAVATTATAWTALSSLVFTLNWGDEIAVAVASGTMYSISTNTTLFATIGLDGTAKDGYASSEESVAGGYSMPFACQYMAKLAQGLHNWSLMAEVGSNTGNYTGALSVVVR